MHHLRLYVHHRTVYNNSYKQSVEAELVQRNWHSVNDAEESREVTQKKILFVSRFGEDKGTSMICNVANWPFRW